MDASLYQLLHQGATLLTASGYLAHGERARYAQWAREQGFSVWLTPRILPWSTYLRLACQQQRSQSAGGPRLLSDNQALVLWQRIVAQSDVDAALLNPLETGRNVQRSWQRLHQYRLSLRAVQAYPGAETQAFCGWAEQFIALTQTRNWLDGARFADFLHESAFQPDTPLILHGFDAITPDMQRLIDRWRNDHVSIHLISSAQQQTNIDVVSAKDAQLELIAAANWARQQCTSGETRIAVVVPDLSKQMASVKRRFTQVFAPGRTDPDIALGFQLVATPPLASYPLVHQALSVLTLLQGNADVLLVGQLLRAPLLAGYEQEAAARARADLIARESRQETWSANDLARLGLVHHCPQWAACWQASHAYLALHGGNALPSQWTERFTQLLKLSGFPRGRTLSSAEQQTFNKLQQLLAELSALDEVLGNISLGLALSTLRNLCQSERFAPEGSDQVVTVIDADSIAGLTFDALWVMGLSANDWPPAPEPDVFLPIELQRQHDLPEATAEGCLRRARHTLTRLVNAASTVVLSWPEQDDEVDLRPSPLLNDFSLSRAIDTHRLMVLRDAQLFRARPMLEQVIDEVAPPLLPGAARGGTRIVELQSRCPFRAQAQLRLGAEPMPTVSNAVEPTERGQLVHRVLSEVWQHLHDAAGLQAADMTDLTAQVAQIAGRIAQQVIAGSSLHRRRLAELEAQLCTQWVMQLLELERTREPFTVLRAEQTEVFELAGMRMRIQLDRIDQLDHGGKLLIDYKTGIANDTGDWLDNMPGRPRSPQLPLYALAHPDLAGLAFAVLAPGKAEFRGLSDRADIAPGIKAYAQLRPNQQLPGVTQWPDLLIHWQQVLNALGQQYLAGVAEVAPLKNECNYCHLHGLCRVQEVHEDLRSEAEGMDV